MLDALSVLVDRSLVAVLSTDADDDERAPRYRLLESPRAYALERLVAAGEHEALQQRHALAMAAQFDAAWDERFDGSIGYDDWMRKMSFDLDNAREALAWAMRPGCRDRVDDRRNAVARPCPRRCMPSARRWPTAWKR